MTRCGFWLFDVANGKVFFLAGLVIGAASARHTHKAPYFVKITRISVFKADLPYVGGAYRWGAGNAIAVARTSVVVIQSDAGISGLNKSPISCS